MSSLKATFNAFFIAIATLAVASCVPTATEKKATCGSNQAFDSVSRSCYSVEQTRRVPVGNAPAQTMSEETPKTITLSYTDANLDQALSCEVSSPSANIIAVAPIVHNGALVNQANTVFGAINTVAALVPAGADSVTALATRTTASTTLDKMKQSFYLPTITSELSSFKVNVSSILAIAALHPTVSALQAAATAANIELNKLNPLITQANLGCTCTAGICTTTIIPKLAKNGTAGFSYTVTDKDGVSSVRPVSITISAMSSATTHLKPVVQSSYLAPASLPAGIYPSGYFNESITSTASAYDVNIGSAGDVYGTAASTMRYYFSGSKNGSNKGITAKGLVSNCMDLTGSSGLNDTSCTYTPNDGNDSGSAVLVKASAAVGADLTYTAKSEGLYGNAITVQYFSLQDDNTVVDSYVTTQEKYGLVGSTESFVRVTGNAIKVFIAPGYTSSYDIQGMINAHPQASKLVTVTGAVPSPLVYPVPVVVTPTAITLTGGTNGYDVFSYYANNTLTNSGNTATAMISIVAANDTPTVPKNYNALFSQTETLLELETKTVTLGFRDPDSTTFNAVEAVVDTDVPVCKTTLTHTEYDAIVASPTNVHFITTPGVPACVSGVCTVTAAVSALGDFAGNACLYYRVTDDIAARSDVQSVNIVVTNINDAPELSSSVLPAITALGTAQVNEDLAAGFNSYTDIYAGPGGGQWEASQLLTVTATSSNTALIPSTACTNYTPVLISPVGVVTPTAVGQKQFDTVAFKCYISTGTATSADWKLMPSLTVFPACAYDVYGQGSPVSVVTPSAANKRYLDTTNNKCYKSASTSSSSWAQEAVISNYKVAYVPEIDKSGTTNITVTVKDSGGVLNSGSDTTTGVLALTVNFVDDPPVFISTITSIHTNEGGAIQSGAFTVDEDAGSTVDEDAQGVSILSLTTDNAGVLPTSAITIFYDLNDNGVEDSGEARAVGAVLEASNADNVKAHSFYLKLDPVDGVSGNANIQLTITDGFTPVTTNFSFIVHQVAALHGGWTNISSVGIKTDKNGAPISAAEIQCNYNKLTDSKKCGTAACTNVTSPNATIVPDAANVIYWDSAAQRCYRSTGTTAFSWVEMNTSCPITRETGICSGNNCITSTNPTGVTTPGKVGQYNFDTTTNTCYVSTGALAANWEVYVPSKVTLSWKPFTMVGSTTDTGVTVAAQISGYNVYRRERNADYNFKGGHLKNASSTSVFTINNATTRTFTDTTAIAGKLYYYVVRPVDNSVRNFPTYTPETFSEVRVVAAPSNYSFVHRWMINQEMCNGMNITSTTSPHHIDQTNNFRCEYTGPGHVTISGTNYFDYGKDLLVDTQEAGCAYGAAPKCSANGCVGIGAPAAGLTANVVANDLYYDRSAGKCYAYSGGWTEMQSVGLAAAMMSKSNTALNAPLTNITKTRAISLCSARATPTLSYNTAGTATPWTLGGAVTLPLKKDYMAYASQKLDVTDPEITEMEQGFSLNIQSRCNGSSASGLDTAFTDSAIPSTSFIYSLPGTFSSGIRSLYTGSIPWGSSKGTEACISRYGIQDLYGNVAEWVNDGMTCDQTQKTCTPVASGSFNGAEFGSAYAFDNVTGPYADTNGDGFVGGTDAFLTQWTFADELFGAGKFNYPLGMPVLDSINASTYSAYMDWILDIGPSNGITTNKLHEDGIIVNASGSTNKAFAVGGSYLSGNRAGRFSSELVDTAVTNRADIGFRCIVPINSGDYQADTFYSYPN